MQSRNFTWGKEWSKPPNHLYNIRFRQKGQGLMENLVMLKQCQELAELLNDIALEAIISFIKIFSKYEKYQKGTTQERYEEIVAQEKAENEAKREQQEAEKRAAYFEQMRTEIEERKQKIANLQGKDKLFWDKIEKVRGLNISRYCLNYSQIKLLASLYHNDYINASGDAFYYGFYQGMQYMKNQYKKKLALTF